MKRTKFLKRSRSCVSAPQTATRVKVRLKVWKWHKNKHQTETMFKRKGEKINKVGFFFGFFKFLPCLGSSAESGGEDWSGPTGCKASIAPWEREQFASVQSKVPFPWHFLDNKSLINHWPWIRIFKGTTGAKTQGARSVRAWAVCVPVTHGACVSAVDGLSKLINSLVSVDVQDVSAHTDTSSRCRQLRAALQAWVAERGSRQEVLSVVIQVYSR